MKSLLPSSEGGDIFQQMRFVTVSFITSTITVTLVGEATGV